MRADPSGPDQRIRRHLCPIAERDVVVSDSDDFTVGMDLYLLLREFSLSVGTELLSEFRQNDRPELTRITRSMSLRRCGKNRTASRRKSFMAGDGFDSRETAAGHDEIQ